MDTPPRPLPAVQPSERQTGDTEPTWWDRLHDDPAPTRPQRAVHRQRRRTTSKPKAAAIIVASLVACFVIAYTIDFLTGQIPNPFTQPVPETTQGS